MERISKLKFVALSVLFVPNIQLHASHFGKRFMMVALGASAISAASLYGVTSFFKKQFFNEMNPDKERSIRTYIKKICPNFSEARIFSHRSKTPDNINLKELPLNPLYSFCNGVGQWSKQYKEWAAILKIIIPKEKSTCKSLLEPVILLDEDKSKTLDSLFDQYERDHPGEADTNLYIILWSKKRGVNVNTMRKVLTMQLDYLHKIRHGSLLLFDGTIILNPYVQVRSNKDKITGEHRFIIARGLAHYLRSPGLLSKLFYTRTKEEKEIGNDFEAIKMMDDYDPEGLQLNLFNWVKLNCENRKNPNNEPLHIDDKPVLVYWYKQEKDKQNFDSEKFLKHYIAHQPIIKKVIQEEGFLDNYAIVDGKLCRKSLCDDSIIFVDEEGFEKHLKQDALIIIDKIEHAIN